MVAGVLLAAGGGRRLGGRPKALLEHRGRPLVEHAVRALRNGGCGPVHVVLGAAAEEVRDLADLSACMVTVNPSWEEGMGSSLRAGLASLSGSDADAALVLLVDQPGIGAEAVARVGAHDAVPVHYGTFWPTGLRQVSRASYRHRFHEPGVRFAAAVAERSPDVRVHVLDHGTDVLLPARAEPGRPAA